MLSCIIFNKAVIFKSSRHICHWSKNWTYVLKVLQVHGTGHQDRDIIPNFSTYGFIRQPISVTAFLGHWRMPFQTIDRQTFRLYYGPICGLPAGIGLGIALRLGQEGAKLVICSRKQVSEGSVMMSVSTWRCWLICRKQTAFQSTCTFKMMHNLLSRGRTGVVGLKVGLWIEITWCIASRLPVSLL